jgi:hypothetical protein
VFYLNFHVKTRYQSVHLLFRVIPLDFLFLDRMNAM